MKKLLLCLAVATTLVVASCSKDEGSDPDAKLFKIETIDDLNEFKYIVENTNAAYSVKLLEDIDLSGAEWEPISVAYSGVFKGNGKKITGLTITTPTSDKLGLFAQSDGATIQDLTISCNIAGEIITTNTSTSVGAFVGYALNTTFTNCSTIDGSTIIGEGNNTAGIAGLSSNCSFSNCTNRAAISGTRYTAGIVAYASDGVTITNSTNEGSITSVSGSYENYTGGIVARMYSGGGSITNCTNSGVVSSTTNCVGGIAGRSQSATIKNCENNADVTGSQETGGVIGYSDTTVVTDCENNAAVTGGKYTGGVIGYSSATAVVNCVNSDDVDGGTNTGGITGGNNSTTTIINCYNTASVTSTGSWVGGVTSDVNSESVVINCYNQGDVSNDGCGIVYRNCGYIYNCYSSVDGAIARTDTGGDAEACYYDNGTADDGTESDGVTGLSSTTMTSSTFVETLSANAQAYNYVDPAPDYLACNWKEVASGYPTLDFGNEAVRGVKTWSISTETELKEILGAIGNETYYSYDTYKLTANITLTEDWTPITYFVSTLDGNNKKISGLNISSDSDHIGLFAECEGATIKNLTIECTIENTGTSNEMIGAFAGKATNSTFTSCATTSNTTVKSLYRNAGGLVGWAVGSTFTSCKNYATVTGAQYVGGMVGTISDASSSTLKSCTNYGSVNAILGSSNSHWGGIAGYFGGSSTITSCTNSGAVTVEIGGHDFIGGIVGQMLSGSSIINSTNSGAVTTTQGRYVGGVAGSNLGVISGCKNSGTISETDDTVSSQRHLNIGGIAGYNYGGDAQIENCENSGEISCPNYNIVIGGVVGGSYTGSTVSSCVNKGTITGGYSYVGGVVGDNTGALTSLTNSGSVSGINQYTGGVVGYSNTSGTITSLTNSGSVSGAEYTGGIVGYNTSATISLSTNSGSVVGLKFTGGIAGQVSSSSTILECLNSGVIESSASYCGGIVGYLSVGNVYSSYNTAKVTALGHVAGIVGEANNSTVFNCYNKGAVTATGTTDEINVAGLVGHLYTTATLRNSYNLGSVTSTTDFVGGLVGTCVSGAQLENCYSAATIVGVGSNVDGAVGSYGGVASQCFYDSTLYTATSNNDSATGMTTTEMKASDFVDTLNDYFVELYNSIDPTPYPLASTWKKVSGGYPTFE